jgi:hypothetical protein
MRLADPAASYYRRRFRLAALPYPARLLAFSHHIHPGYRRR